MNLFTELFFIYLVSNGGLLLGRVITEVLETGNRDHAVSMVVSV